MARKIFCRTAVLIFALCMFATMSKAQVPGEIKTKAEKEAAGTVKAVSQKTDPMEEIDALIDSKEMGKIKKAISLCKSILKSDPNNFEATWRCAKAYREYGEAAKKGKVRGWKDICAEYGKKGMQYAQKAIRQRPDKVNGYYYYGLNVGIYSDGKGILTALKEGLKNKTQSNLEKAYQMDKYFDKAGPILALGRFWQVVPFPFTDKDKALKLYREFQHTKYFADSIEGHVYLAELLADTGSSIWGGNKNASEVKQLISELNRLTSDPYWRNWGKRILKDL